MVLNVVRLMAGAGLMGACLAGSPAFCDEISLSAFGMELRTQSDWPGFTAVAAPGRAGGIAGAAFRNGPLEIAIVVIAGGGQAGRMPAEEVRAHQAGLAAAIGRKLGSEAPALWHDPDGKPRSYMAMMGRARGLYYADYAFGGGAMERLCRVFVSDRAPDPKAVTCLAGPADGLLKNRAEAYFADLEIGLPVEVALTD